MSEPTASEQRVEAVRCWCCGGLARLTEPTGSDAGKPVCESCIGGKCSSDYEPQRRFNSLDTRVSDLVAEVERLRQQLEAKDAVIEAHRKLMSAVETTIAKLDREISPTSTGHERQKLLAHQILLQRGVTAVRAALVSHPGEGKQKP